MRPIPSTAVDFVAKHEGLKLTAYQDVADVWTIGYGHTGTDVRAGLVITPAEARALLADDLAIAAARLEARIGAVIAELTDQQYAALLSFVFNLGAGAGWTIWKRLKARQFDQVPGEMIKFVNAGGKKVKGLVNRRTAEIDLWSTYEPGSTAEVLPSSVTREIATPPTPADPHPPQKSATVLTGALGVVTGVPLAAKTVSDAIEPYKDASPFVAQAWALLATVAAAAVVAVLVLTYLSKRKARA